MDGALCQDSDDFEEFPCNGFNVRIMREFDDSVLGCEVVNQHRFRGMGELLPVLQKFPNINEIGVRNCPQFVGTSFFAPWVNMYVEECPLFTGAHLPDGLRELRVSVCRGFTGEHLPQGVGKLYVDACAGFSGNKLPRGLRRLGVYDCANFVGENLPPSLVWMTAKNCPRFEGSGFDLFDLSGTKVFVDECRLFNAAHVLAAKLARVDHVDVKLKRVA